MYQVECKFPEFNRVATLFCNPTEHYPQGGEQPSPYLGCMTGYVGNVYVRMPTGGSQLSNFIRVLDTTKEPAEAVFIKSSFGKVISQEEITRISNAIATYQLPEEERVKLFKAIAAGFTKELGKGMSTTWQPAGDAKYYPMGATFVMLADNINSYTPDFPKNSGIASSGHIKNCKTSDFANWLRDSKTGVLVASPIGRNQHHGSPKNFSLTQMWIWVPPQHCGFLLPESWYISGTEQMPKTEEWYEKVTHNLPHLKTQAEIDQAIFKGGKPPIFTRPQI